MAERNSPGDFWLIPFCLLAAAETFLPAQDAVRVSVRESLVYEWQIERLYCVHSEGLAELAASLRAGSPGE